MKRRGKTAAWGTVNGVREVSRETEVSRDVTNRKIRVKGADWVAEAETTSSLHSTRVSGVGEISNSGWWEIKAAAGSFIRFRSGESEVVSYRNEIKMES